MSIHLITGRGTTDHITSADVGSLQAGIVGTGRYVLNRGSKFAYDIVTNNLIKIKDGDLLNQGRHINIAVNDYEECIIENGLQSVKRNDLIVARYTRNSETEIETVSMVVIKGTSGDKPTDPPYTTGDILAGNTLDEFPLYRVRLNGLNIEGVDTLFTINKGLKEVSDEVEYLQPLPTFSALGANLQSGKVVDSLLEKTAISDIWTRTGKNLLNCNLANLKSMNTNGVWADVNATTSTFVVAYKTSTTSNVTFTIHHVNGNVTSIDVNGMIPSDYSASGMIFLLYKNMQLNKKSYTLSGCPSGGDQSRFGIEAYVVNDSGSYYSFDNGTGTTINGQNTAEIHIYIAKNVLMNHTFYPMLRYESVLDNTYEPYLPSNAELNSNLVSHISWIELSVTTGTKGTCKYRVFPDGIVEIRLDIQNIPSGSNVLFTLPSTARPIEAITESFIPYINPLPTEMTFYYVIDSNGQFLCHTIGTSRILKLIRYSNR